MLATFAELLWVLFGDVCLLYAKSYKLWGTHLQTIPTIDGDLKNDTIH